MKKLFTVSLLVFSCTFSQAQDKTIDEYCFTISDSITIGIAKKIITPKDFLNQNRVEAVINGVYYGKNGEPDGIAFLADNHHLGSGKGDIRGYFTVNKAGTEVKVTEHLNNDYSKYWFVIGTHPILILKGKVHSQAGEDRYNVRPNRELKKAFRSAIGTKDGRNICFVVSKSKISMAEWAQQLLNEGYYSAINLDGGPVSQLAVRGESLKGGGTDETHLVIFAYRH